MNLNHNPEEFFAIPALADTTIREKKERYEQKVEEAKERMKALGFPSLLDHPVEKPVRIPHHLLAENG